MQHKRYSVLVEALNICGLLDAYELVLETGIVVCTSMYGEAFR